ncbi:hypothetical protein D3C74_104750 [compost metagenome]
MKRVINNDLVNWAGVGEFKEDAASLEEKIKSLEQENNKLTLALAEVGVSLGQAAVETDQFAGKAGTAAESAKAQEEALADLREQIQGNSTLVGELTGVLNDLTKGQSMNAAAATDLILKYPELAAQIYKTADGWAFEKDAIEELRQKKITKARTDLESERASTFNTKVEADKRLEAYHIEAEAIKNLAQLKAALFNGVMAKSSLEVETRQKELNNMTGVKSFMNAPFQNQLNQEKQNMKELEDIYSEYEKDNKAYDHRINVLTNLYKDRRFGVSDSSGKKDKKKGKSDAEKAAEKASKEAAEARKDSYSDDMDNFKYIAERNEWSIVQQIAGYKRLGQRHKQYLIEDKDAMKQWSRDVQKLNDSRFQEDVENLERRTERMRQANKQEIEMVKTSLDFYKKEQSKSYLLTANRREIQK